MTTFGGWGNESSASTGFARNQDLVARLVYWCLGFRVVGVTEWTIAMPFSAPDTQFHLLACVKAIFDSPLTSLTLADDIDLSPGYFQLGCEEFCTDLD